MKKGAIRIIFPKLAGVAIFLVVLGMLNSISRFITWKFFNSTLNFFNHNALLITLVIVVVVFAELLSKTKYPSNIYSPPANGIAAWLILNLSFNLLESINSRYQFQFLEKIFLIRDPIYVGIISITILFGVLPIMYNLIKNEKNSELEEESEKETIKKKRK